MPHSPAPRNPPPARRVALAAVLVVAATSAGCFSSPTAPKPGPATISGSVYLPGGAPAAGAEVSLVSTTPQSGFGATFGIHASATGEFSIDSMPSANYSLVAGIRPAGGLFEPYRLVAAGRVTMPDPPHPVTLGRLSLQPAGAFRGRVVSASSPIPSLTVFCEELIVLTGATTDSNGVFVLGGIPPGTWHIMYGLFGLRSMTGPAVTMPRPGATVLVPDFVMPAYSPREAGARPSAPLARRRSVR